MQKPQSTELLDRVRRIETRLTQFMIAQGVEPRGERPEFNAGRGVVTIPSEKCSLKEILDCVPKGWQGNFHVDIGGSRTVTMAKL